MANARTIYRPRCDGIEEIAHDARNMVTALSLYCDLLEEPGVLTPGYRHYAKELRAVAEASRHLVDKLAQADGLPMAARLATESRSGRQELTIPAGQKPAIRPEPKHDEWIADLRADLLANRNLLAAIAGSAVNLAVDVAGGSCPVSITSEDLTRLLVNLVKNAADAMKEGGSITIRLCDGNVRSTAVPSVLLTVEDSGPGIPDELLEKVFESGFTTSGAGSRPSSAIGVNWPANHRGLGLSIVRSIVEAAGGRIQARSGARQASRNPGTATLRDRLTGAQFEIELPICNQ